MTGIYAYRDLGTLDRKPVAEGMDVSQVHYTWPSAASERWNRNSTAVDL